MFKKLLTILFISLTFFIHAEEKAVNSLDLWKKDLEKLDGYRVCDFIKINLYHQIINYLENNKLFSKEGYFHHLKTLQRDLKLSDQQTYPLTRMLNDMQKIARIKNNMKNLCDHDIDKFFDQMHIVEKNEILFHLVCCYIEEKDIGRASSLILHMQNHDPDTTLRQSDFLHETYWGIAHVKPCKDKALLEFVKFYVHENDLDRAIAFFDKIKAVPIKFSGFREILKVMVKKQDVNLPTNILKFFQEKFLEKVIAESPINYMFWLDKYEPAIFYYFLESHVRNYSTNLVYGEHPIWDQIKGRPGQAIGFKYLDSYQKIIRYILAQEYEKIADENIYFANALYGTSNFSAMVKAKLLEAFYKEWDPNESTLSIEYADIGDYSSSHFGKVLLLMTNYCKRGFWEKADEIFNKESSSHNFDDLGSSEFEAYKLLIYYMEKDKQSERLDSYLY